MTRNPDKRPPCLDSSVGDDDYDDDVILLLMVMVMMIMLMMMLSMMMMMMMMPMIQLLRMISRLLADGAYFLMLPHQ